jgi:hypothetical protein
MPWQRSRLAPYGSVRAFLRFLQAARRWGWPQRVDAPFLQAMGFRGGAAWELLVALRFLGLVEAASDRPTHRYAWLLSPWDEARPRLAQAVHNAYKRALGGGQWQRWTREGLERVMAERYGKGLARRQAAFALGLARAMGLAAEEAPQRRRQEWGGGEEERPEKGGEGLRQRYLEVLLRRLERADAKEAEALARRIERLLARERGRPGAWRRLLALLGRRP